MFRVIVMMFTPRCVTFLSPFFFSCDKFAPRFRRCLAVERARCKMPFTVFGAFFADFYRVFLIYCTVKITQVCSHICISEYYITQLSIYDLLSDYYGLTPDC
jgi:hypothetical protein